MCDGPAGGGEPGGVRWGARRRRRPRPPTRAVGSPSSRGGGGPCAASASALRAASGSSRRTSRPPSVHSSAAPPAERPKKDRRVALRSGIRVDFDSGHHVKSRGEYRRGALYDTEIDAVMPAWNTQTTEMTPALRGVNLNAAPASIEPESKPAPLVAVAVWAKPSR